jgi:hypothetical protein
MNPHSRYYRKPFWLGLFIILFLVGAWLRSSFYRDEAGVSFFYTANATGEITFIWNPNTKNQHPYADTGATFPRRLWLPSSSYFYKRSSGVIVVSFAHWFLILLTLLSWLILLAWKRQQLQLLTKMEKGAEAETEIGIETGADRKTKTPP